MQLSSYPVNVHDEQTYWFVSTGSAGSIYKVVLFQDLFEGNRVNLALGDVNIRTGEVDFESLTNNGDARKVFNTIAEIVKDYTDSLPEKAIFITGNTFDKKRVYSVMVSAYFSEICEGFDIWGGDAGKSFEMFTEGKIYDAILIKRKKKSNFT